MSARAVGGRRRIGGPGAGAGDAGAGRLRIAERRGYAGRRPEPALAVAAPSLFDVRGTSVADGPGGEPTLDDVLAGAWEGLTARSVVACPVCGAAMAPAFSAPSSAVAGSCRECAAELS